ncbi:sulfurtransferase TusA family protein [Halorutilales archaeon Cl-col2-1]
MTEVRWEDVLELPDEVDDETAEELYEEADTKQDMMGETCPYPQLEAKKAVDEMEEGELLVQETDHVPSAENVPNAVEDDAEAKVWSDGGTYRIFLWKK